MHTLAPRSPVVAWPAWLLWLCGCLAAWCCVLSSALAQDTRVPAEPPAELVLSANHSSVALWPHVRLWDGGGAVADWQEARRQFSRFVPVPSAHATLGVRAEAVWLHVPLRVLPGARGLWAFDIDYPPINDVAVYLERDGALVLQDRLGNLVPRSERQQLARAPTTQLMLAEGRYDLWLRVQSAGGLVLPMSLSRPAAYHGRALQEQMLQGLLNGLALCLLVYSLAQWLTLRDTLFLKYGLLLVGSFGFTLAVFGVGRQFLWGDWPWVEARAAGLFSLLAATGSFLFIEHALRGADTSRRWRQTMHLGAVVCVTVALAYVLNLLPLRVVTALMSVLGVMPALMGVRGAFRLARSGDAIGQTLLTAWVVYALAAATMIGLIQGALPVNFFTQHAFQLGATLDALLFMRVLGLRTQAMARAAQQARHDLGVMASLAQTDPLTGLPNRRGLNAALAEALPLASPGRLLALYVLDLDGFKPVNDRFGHDVGDELLVAVAQRLRAHIRNSDVVARVGGDEFVLMAMGLSDERAAHELGAKLCNAFVEPFVVAGHSLQVGLTAGYALAPTDGDDVVELLKRADMAMYAGKQAGKQRLIRAWVTAT